MSTNENLIGGPCKHGGIGVLCHECRIEQLQTENAKLKEALEHKAECLKYVEKDINKIKADAIQGLITSKFTNVHIEGNEWPVIYVEDAHAYANRVEKGND